MTIQLIEGRYYARANSEIVGPMHKGPNPEYCWVVPDGNNYRDDGTFSVPGEPCHLDLIREATPEEIAAYLGEKPVEKFNPDEAYKAHKETTWHGPMPPETPVPVISEARIAEIRREAIDAAANCSPLLTSGTLARSCLDALDAFAAVADENEHLRKSCDEWAEISQRNYQRALAAEAERDRAMKACDEIAKRFTPRRLRYAPKDRIIIGVNRPPFEETTFYYDIIWSESRQQFVTPCVEALNGASHFLDPRDLIGLPPQERKPRKPRADLEQEPS